MEQDQPTRVNITDLLREQARISSEMHQIQLQIWNLKEELRNLVNREDEIEEALDLFS